MYIQYALAFHCERSASASAETATGMKCLLIDTFQQIDRTENTRYRQSRAHGERGFESLTLGAAPEGFSS
ncbi:hypothetical protein CA54_00600 [Symmachiella macrocystis]|uniref:Uncharacterized protein n=1 Tax=Symmachiella macrocystis TaxID=2527985 RepID=A0A5C6BGF5_9PLAN|nr:hypothetical protein CA54_00600 [Symmachiella macrocystis]